MRAQDVGKERGRGNGPAGQQPRQPQVPGWAAQVLALQRQVGNATVSRAIAEGRHEHGAGCGHGDTPVRQQVPAVQRVVDDDAIAPAPQQAGAGPGHLDGQFGREIPAYWDELDWSPSQNGYQTAVLPREHAVWAAVAKYANLSQELAPVTAPKGERTRMEASKDRLKATDLTPEQRASHELRIQEGKPGGPPPPSSAYMDIVEIVVCANPTLWQRYATSRQQYRQGLTTIGEKGWKVRGDRSQDVPWSTGSRPNLDNAAQISSRDGYQRPAPESRPSVAPPQDAGEGFFWHGTSPAVMELLNKGGAAPKLGRNKNAGTDKKPEYGVLGQGTYVADNTSKAQTYFACPTCEGADCQDPTHAPRELMLMRGLVGSPDFAHLWQNRRGDDHKSTLKTPLTTSVVSPSLKKKPKRLGATGTNEFLIKDAVFLYPEIRVRYRRSAAPIPIAGQSEA